MNFRRAFAALAALLALSGPVFSQTASRDDVLEAVGKCAGLAGDKERLACYDALAPRVKDALGTPPPSLAGRAPTKEEQQSWFGFDISNLFGASPAQQTTPQQFGADKLPETATKVEEAMEAVDSIAAGVKDVAFTPFGKFIVFLDNGQVWRQIEGDSEHAHFPKDLKDLKVTVERGFMGSYNLKIGDSVKIFKVTRVK